MSSRRSALPLRLLCGVSCALAGLGSVPALAAEPADTRAAVRTSLVWVFGDDDVLHAPAETTPPSPSAGIGDRAGYASLFEGLGSRYTGRENRSELRLEGEAPGLVPRVVTRAGLVLGFDLSGLSDRPAPLLVEDLGSYAELEWQLRTGDAKQKNALVVRLLPLNGDRERVGELERLAWGGAVGPNWESPYASALGPVRAGRLDLLLGIAHAHVGLKTASFLEAEAAGPAVAATSYGFYGGVTSRWRAPIGVALAAGHFEHGRLPGTAGAPGSTTTGASLRLSWAAGLERALPPVAFARDGSPFDEHSPGPWRHGFAFGLEGAHLVQRLWDFDHPGASVLAPARAVAALAELHVARIELRVAATAREPAFVMRNGPGVFPGQTLPRDAAERLELGLAASVSAMVSERIIPSLSLGVLAPAAVMTRGVDRLGQPIGTTLVVRGPADVETLPPGATPVPVLEARPGLELKLSELFQALGWLDYERDFNRTRLVPSAGGALARGFRRPDRLGFGVAARAVW